MTPHQNYQPLQEKYRRINQLGLHYSPKDILTYIISPKHIILSGRSGRYKYFAVCAIQRCQAISAMIVVTGDSKSNSTKLRQYRQSDNGADCPDNVLLLFRNPLIFSQYCVTRLQTWPICVRNCCHIL